MTREVLWGEALFPKVRRYPGGMNAIAELARAECGRTVGGRTSFSDLYDAEGVPDDEAARFRAWIVLTVVHETPEEWGIDTADAVPPAIDAARLRDLLIRGSSWNPESAGHGFAFDEAVGF